MELERLTYTVEEAGRILGISRGLAYALVKAGDIPAVQLGRRLVVPRPALQALLEDARLGAPASEGIVSDPSRTLGDRAGSSRR